MGGKFEGVNGMAECGVKRSEGVDVECGGVGGRSVDVEWGSEGRAGHLKVWTEV